MTSRALKPVKVDSKDFRRGGQNLVAPSHVGPGAVPVRSSRVATAVQEGLGPPTAGTTARHQKLNLAPGDRTTPATT